MEGCPFYIFRAQIDVPLAADYYYSVLSKTFMTMSQMFNFTPHLNAVYRFSEHYRDVFHVMMPLHFLLEYFHDVHFETTFPEIIITEYCGFMIPLGETYSDLEKFLLPFHVEVWIALLFTFLITFIVIFVISLCASEKFKDFIFGDRVRTPGLNVLIAFYGGSQTILPKYNFARFLLTMFIIFSLVIRTCYQGELFKYLQGNQHKKEAETFDDLMRGNYEIYIDKFSYDRLKFMEIFRHHKNLKVFTAADDILRNEKLYTSINSSTIERKCIYSCTADVTLYNKRSSTNDTYMLMEQKLHHDFLTIAFNKNNFMIENFNLIAIRLKESGLIDYWDYSTVYKKIITAMQVISEPKVLTINQLRYGFIICCVPLVISIFVFYVEIIFKSFSK
jgi:hypothetical protein